MAKICAIGSPTKVPVVFYLLKDTARRRYGTAVYTFVGRCTVEIGVDLPVSETFVIICQTANTTASKLTKQHIII